MQVNKELAKMLIEDYVDESYESNYKKMLKDFIGDLIGERLLVDKKYLGGLTVHYDGSREERIDSDDLPMLEDKMRDFILKYFPDMPLRVFVEIDKTRIIEKTQQSTDYYGSEDFYEQRRVEIKNLSEILMLNGFITDDCIDIQSIDSIYTEEDFNKQKKIHQRFKSR